MSLRPDVAHDDEDENYITYGEPLEDEDDQPTKNPTAVGNQVVKDAQGRRRFHGAFTGGFSAGYFNSVGSKGGWTPSTFTSSRSSRGEKKQQSAEDFMDEEDLGVFGIAPRQVHASDQFASAQRQQRETSSDDTSAIPGDAPLRDLIAISNSSVGTKILHQMGWREGQGVGPKVRKYKKKLKGPTPTEQGSIEDVMQDFMFGPSDVEEFLFKMESDQKGLGYSGIHRNTSILGGPVNSFGAPQSNHEKKQKGISGSAFGIGAFEDRDEDVYSVEDMTMYDRVLGGDDSEGKNFGWTAPKSSSSSKQSIEGFTPAVKTKSISNKVFPPPSLPPGFHPVHEFPDSTAPRGGEMFSRFTLSSEQRSILLGEEILPGKPVLKEDQSNVAAPAASGSKEPSSEPEKKSRFSAPVEGRGTEVVIYQDKKVKSEEGGITEWERQRSELTRTASLRKPMADMMASRFVSAKYEDEEVIESQEVTEVDKSHHENAADMKMYGKLTRETYEWYPDHVLCKRFNVPDPYPGSSFVGVPGLQKEKVSVYNFFANPGDFQQPLQPSPPAGTCPPPDNNLVGTKGPVPEGGETKKRSRWDLKPAILSIIEERRNNTSPVNTMEEIQADQTGDQEDETRPPLDLFNAIFNESDSSDSDDSKSDKEEETDVKPEIRSTDEPTVGHLDEPSQSDIKATESDDDQIYGPALPPPHSSIQQLGVGAVEVTESSKRQSRTAHRKHKKHHHSHSSRHRSESRKREKKEMKKKSRSKESHRKKSRGKHKKRRPDSSDSSHTSASEG